jgi:VWFA-related protein
MIARRPNHLRIAVLALLAFVLWCVSGAVGRSSSAQSSPAPQTQSNASQQASPSPLQPSAGATAPANAREMDMHESPLPLRTNVTAVPVRVVVRDKNGHAVSTLQREDFQLFEDGKPQTISNFIVETLPSLTNQLQSPSGPAQSANAKPVDFLPPSRFVALLFDDAHTSLQDLMVSRNTVTKYLDDGLPATERIAVFTVSGQDQVDFTDDRPKLKAALAKLLPHSTIGDMSLGADECPPMDYYEADQIQNKNDSEALQVAFDDTIHCDPGIQQDISTSGAAAAAGGGQSGLSPSDVQRAQALVQATAIRIDQQGSGYAEQVFRALRMVVTRLSALPGQRNLVLISPGFIFPDDRDEYSKLVDQAIRQNVFLNTLDARGLYTPDMGDISQRANIPDPTTVGIRHTWQLALQQEQTDLLRYLAGDTGGFSFHDNNDLAEGIRQVASPPEAYYYLAFSPENMKFDGKYHSLKVTLNSKEKYTIQTRRGFYSPSRHGAPVDVAKQDIEDAVFSQEEQHGLPVALQTQFFKTDAENAKLSVLAHVDLAHMHFEKADGRNQNDLTVVAALFDRNGNFITGTQRVVQMRLRDETLQKLAQTGMTVRTNFDVKPGDYVVRLVVRDSKAAQLSAENGVVEIPY